LYLYGQISNPVDCPKLAYLQYSKPSLRCVYNAAGEQEDYAFDYDNLDRFKTMHHGTPGTLNMAVNYQNNGNIQDKTGLGAYGYGANGAGPHAVTSVTAYPSSVLQQNVTHTAFNRPKTISQGNYFLDIVYGPDQKRWKTVLQENNAVTKTIIFAGDYEQIFEDGITKQLIYLPGGGIYVKQAGQTDNIYYTHKDHLGSILKITDAAGAAVFSATYDAWGKQTLNPGNAFHFHRGYTGHEHLHEFELINMNGRMYDPIVGRMLSPDRYVVDHTYSQDYNRYTYARNNPLIYTDPTGEFIFTILAAIFCPPLTMAALQLDMAWMQGGFTSMANGDSFWSGAGKGFVVGLANAGLSFLNVPGMIPNGLLHAGGNVLTNGLSNVMWGQDFWQGAGWQAGFGFAGGAYSGFQLSKESGLNYWWGNEVKYGRNQWSFFTSEKPYDQVNWNLKNVGSQRLNDCVPTSYAEMNDYFGGNTSYDEYRRITGYQEDVGVVGRRSDYERMLGRNFTGSEYTNPSALADPQVARNIQNNGQLIHTNMPHSGIRHADNLRSISYYSNKTVLRYRIGSYRLSSVNDNWWFYLFNGIR